MSYWFVSLCRLTSLNLKTLSNLDRVVIHRLGMGMQFIVLAGLPMLIYWQLMYSFRLVLMPACLLAGIVIFSIGTKLRES